MNRLSDFLSPPSIMQRIGFAVALTCITILAAWLYSAGFDPPSLWQDDQWLSIVVRKMTWGEYVRLAPPVPVGFVAIEKALSAISPTSEWSLQVLPMACGIAAAPLMAWLVVRITGRKSLALLAAALVVVDPILTIYALRCKQYAVDAAVTVTLLLAGYDLLRQWSTRRAWLFAAAAIAATVITHTSIFISLPLLHVALAMALWRQPRNVWAWVNNLLPAVAVNGVVLLCYLIFWRRQDTPALREFWRDWFLTGADGSVVLSSLLFRAYEAVVWALPPGVQFTAWLGVIGLVVLFMHKHTRAFGVCIAMTIALIITAAAAGRYPVGTGRLDLFHHPITWLLVCIALHGVANVQHVKRYAGPVLFIIAVAVLAVFNMPSEYPHRLDGQLVQALARTAEEDDGIVLYPMAGVAAGAYGPWPMRFEKSTGFEHGFDVIIERKHTLILPPTKGFRENPAVLDRLLLSFLSDAPDRVYYLATHVRDHPTHAYLVTLFEFAGYRTVMREKPAGADAELIVFQR